MPFYREVSIYHVIRYVKDGAYYLCRFCPVRTATAVRHIWSPLVGARDSYLHRFCPVRTATAGRHIWSPLVGVKARDDYLRRFCPVRTATVVRYI